MKRKDVEKLELRMRTLRICLREDLEDLLNLQEKLDGKHMRTEGIDYIIQYIKSNIGRLCLDIGLFERTMDMEMKECFYYLRETCKEGNAPVMEQEYVSGIKPGATIIDIDRGSDCTPREELPTDDLSGNI